MLTFRCLSDAPKSLCPLTPLTSMLRTSISTNSSTNLTQIVVEYDGVDDGGGRSGDFDRKTSTSTDSSASAAQIGVDYNGVDDGATSLIFKTSSSTDASTSAAQIVVEFDKVDASSVADGKSVKKSSKCRKIVKKSKKLQKLKKNLQRPWVWRNIYQSTNLPSIRYEELELPLEF